MNIRVNLTEIQIKIPIFVLGNFHVKLRKTQLASSGAIAEITSLDKRYIKDIQLLIVRLRFLVAPLFKKEKSLNFIEVQGFFFFKHK